MDGSASPVFTSERMLPPTEVEWSVDQKGPWVQIRISCNSREVNDYLMLTPEGAILLADHLEDVAEQLDD
jgi:hypothetical protein